MSKSCTVYIDESGDLGANRGTKLFYRNKELFCSNEGLIAVS